MSSSTNTTVKQIWKKLTNKEYRDSYVTAHISNTVASQIFMLREARGWTQKELANKAGMSQSRISALEDPNYENIEVGTLKRLASAFDVAVTVRFTPFSELATWTAELSAEKLLVPDFTNDRAPETNAPPELFVLHVATSGGPSVYNTAGGALNQGFAGTYVQGGSGGTGYLHSAYGSLVNSTSTGSYVLLQNSNIQIASGAMGSGAAAPAPTKILEVVNG
jgi:transcriptional regulator with XRE-family HTH domain